VICSSGYRSSVVASLIAATGHVSVRNVLGGITAWTAANYHTEI
jgi:hydroxyacylglutathione hydrolase